MRKLALFSMLFLPLVVLAQKQYYLPTAIEERMPLIWDIY